MVPAVRTGVSVKSQFVGSPRVLFPPIGMAKNLPWIFVIVALSTFCVLHMQRNQEVERTQAEVVKWLHSVGLDKCKKAILNAGIENLVQLVILYRDNTLLSQLNSEDQARLEKSVRSLKELLVLQQWLEENSVTYPQRLLEKLGSLDVIAEADDSIIAKAFGDKIHNWHHAKRKLSTNQHDIQKLKADLWENYLYANSQTGWTTGSMVVFSLFLATVVAVASMTQPVLTTDPLAAKHSFFEYVTGKYLVPQNCRVFFDWDEPKTVGDTMSFTVRFYQRNGQPYPICNKDNLLIEITQGSYKVATSVEIGGTDPNMANSAKCKFTVRRAGEYRISIMIGNNHIKGSPFVKRFMSGSPDPFKTGFVHHCSTIVCTHGLPHNLLIEPRDEYGNLCVFTNSNEAVAGYKVEVTQSEDKNLINCHAKLDYDLVGHRLTLELCFEEEGCYKASMTYYNNTLKNGDFNIIVLNANEANIVQRNVAKKSHNVWYEARLLSIDGENLAKPKKVYCYVSPKQLTIKEFILKIIPKRLLTFRLCPSTKFQFSSGNNQHEEPAFVIEDGCQPKVELMTPERNVIAATFTQFLLKNIGGSETFKDKQEFFYHEVRKLHQKRYHDKITLRIQRDKLLESSMKATKNFATSDWCKNFEITFQGEPGLDWGGLRREWFELVCSHLFDAEHQLFMHFKDDKQGLVHPNSKRPAHLKLKHYEFAGKVVGKSLYESALGGSYRQLVKARFSRSFLAQLIGLRVHYKYFEQDDPDLYMTKIKYIIENDVDDMDLYFVEEEYSNAGQLMRVIELIPNGEQTAVTSQNKFQYLDALAQYRLATSVKDEVEHFLKGLNDLIPDNLLSIFDENELELLMCGTGQFSIADFKANHTVSGSSYEFRKVLDWFWTAVSNFTEEEMARLLQFTTGCSQLPPGGFAELTPRFQITAAPTVGNLPTAHTCFNQLCLPDYETYEQFEKALLLAINEGSEGFGMI